MSKFLITSIFKWIDPKHFDVNKCSSNILIGCVLDIDLEYRKELRELHSYYPFGQYQLMIADFYNIPIGNVKRLVTNLVDKEKYVLQYEHLQR